MNHLNVTGKWWTYVCFMTQVAREIWNILMLRAGPVRSHFLFPTLPSRWWSRRTCSHLLLREHQNLNWLLNSHWQGAVETHWEKINHIQGQRRSCKDGRGKITIKSNPISTRWVTKKLENNNTKEVLALLWRFYAPHQSSQPGESSKKTGNPTWRTVGFDYRTPTELEETEGTNKI